MKFAENLKMVYKLIIMALFIGVLPLVISNLLVHNHQTKVNTQEIYSQSETKLESIKEQLGKYKNNAETQLKILSQDKFIAEYLANGGEGDVSNAYLRSLLDTKIPDTLENLKFTDLVLVDAEGIIKLQYKYPTVDDKGYSGKASSQIANALAGKLSWGAIEKKQNGTFAMAVARPVMKDDKQVGVVNFSATIEEIDSIIHDGLENFGQTTKCYLINSEGMLVTDVREFTANESTSAKEFVPFEFVVKNDGAQKLMQAIKSGNSDFTYTGVYTGIGDSKVLGSMGVVQFGDTRYGLLLEVDEKEAFEGSRKESFTMICLICLFVIYDLVISWLFALRITKPLGKIVSSTENIRNYDLNTEVDELITRRNDEIGQVGKAVEIIRQSMKELVTKISGSAGDVLDASLQLKTSAEQSSIATSEVAATVHEISKGASDQADTTMQSAEKLKDMGKRVEEETNAIENVSLQMENVQNHVNEGQQIIQELFRKNELSTEASKIVSESIRLAQDCAKKISEVSTFIASIASQTNLLSLNASIEAARAGEAGRGFSVVATEIQKLADQSTDSTRTIDEIVAEIVKAVETAVEKTNESVKMLNDQTEIVRQTSEKFDLIAEASNESKAAVDKLSETSKVIYETSKVMQDSIASLAAIAEENAASAEETHASVEEQSAMVMSISDESGHLANLAQELEDTVKKFNLINRVRE